MIEAATAIDAAVIGLLKAAFETLPDNAKTNGKLYLSIAEKVSSISDNYM